MRKTMIILLLALIMLPLGAQAQDGGKRDITGEYDLSGAYLDGSEPYAGSGTIQGSGSIYLFGAVYDEDEPDEDVFLDPMLLLGDVIVDAYGYEDTDCSDTAYARLDDGKLLGMWLDSLTGYSVGVEVLTPAEATSGFAGTYAIQGIYPDGTPYTGTVTISEGEGGAYQLDYDYPADEVYDELNVTGYGLAAGNVLGVSLTLDPEADGENCAIYVAEFADDGSFSGTWYEYGEFGTESGTPK